MTENQKVILNYLRGNRRFPVASFDWITEPTAIKVQGFGTFTLSKDGNSVLKNGRVVARKNGSGWKEDIISFYTLGVGR